MSLNNFSGDVPYMRKNFEKFRVNTNTKTQTKIEKSVNTDKQKIEGFLSEPLIRLG